MADNDNRFDVYVPDVKDNQTSFNVADDGAKKEEMKLSALSANGGADGQYDDITIGAEVKEFPVSRYLLTNSLCGVPKRNRSLQRVRVAEILKELLHFNKFSVICCKQDFTYMFCHSMRDSDCCWLSVCGTINIFDRGCHTCPANDIQSSWTS